MIIGGMDGHDIAKLSLCGLFSGIEPEDLAAGLSRMRAEVRSYPGGAIVLLGGCRYDALRVLLDGEAKAEMASEDGKTVRVESFRAPEAIATAILFSPSMSLPVTVTAHGACRVAVIPKDGLLDLCAKHRPVLEALLGDMGARLSALAERHRAVQFSTLRERIADWLVRRADLSGSGVVTLESSKERLAELFGVARPSLSREFMELERKGLLSVEGRTVRILDLAGLRRLRPR